jgi:hypothetical protein
MRRRLETITRSSLAHDMHKHLCDGAYVSESLNMVELSRFQVAIFVKH